MDNLILNYEISNLIRRLKHGFFNLLPNSGMEVWLNGTTVAPNGWTTRGAAAVARSATAQSGQYSAQVTLSGTGQALEASFSPLGDTHDTYTHSMYYQCLSGTGKAKLECSADASIYQELDNTVNGLWKLALISQTVPDCSTAASYDVGIMSNDAGNSVWLIDEVMCQEGLDIAIPWSPSPMYAEKGTDVYVRKNFLAGIMAASPSPPAAANARGTAGQIEWDSTYVYLCLADRNWVSFKKDASWKP